MAHARVPRDGPDRKSKFLTHVTHDLVVIEHLSLDLS